MAQTVDAARSAPDPLSGVTERAFGVLPLLQFVAALPPATLGDRSPSRPAGGRVRCRAGQSFPGPATAASRSARAVASDGPYQVSCRPLTSTLGVPGKASGPSSGVNASL